MFSFQFKDEFGGKKECIEFVGLRSKSYSFLFSDNTEKKTCKGVPRIVIKNDLTFQKYKDCLFKRKTFRHQSTSIASQKQEVKTLVKNKVSLSAFDSKIQLKNCGICGEKYGSKNINFNCNENHF